MNHTPERPAEEDNPEGRYVNYFKVGYNADVFVMDYFQIFPEGDEAQKHTIEAKNPSLRLITTPSDARQLLRHLKASINEFEDAYGKIEKSDGT